MRLKSLLAFIACFACVSLTGCGSGPVDYSKVAAQTGGPEQGVWQDRSGIRLELNSGKFKYAKAKNAAVLTGTYKSADGTIQMTADAGETVTAQFPDPNGPLTVDGATLTKTE